MTRLGARTAISVQLAGALRALIRDQELGPGARLPAEHELAARFGVARGSVREALKALANDGLVEVRHGSGTFVTPLVGLSVQRPVTTFESVTEMLRHRGYEPVNRVLSLIREAPTEEEKDAFRLADGEDVVRLERMRQHDGTLLILSMNVFPADVLDDAVTLRAADFAGSLDTRFTERGRQLVSAAAALQTARLPAAVAAMPEARGHRDWLLITERCVDISGRTLLLSRDYHRGDVFSFNVVRRVAA